MYKTKHSPKGLIFVRGKQWQLAEMRESDEYNFI